MPRLHHYPALLAFLALLAPAFSQQPAGLIARTPATPLIVHNPYFSLWSFGDDLAASPTRHWSGTPQPLTGILRVDGVPLRFMGAGRGAQLPQLSRTLWPTRTIYRFEGAGVHLRLTFFTPALPQDINVLSRPLSYLIWTVRSTDGKEHAVRLTLGASALLAVNQPSEPVVWGGARVGDLRVLSVGTSAQPVLQTAGDRVRIDWGWFYLAAPEQPGLTTRVEGRQAFAADVRSGLAPAADDLNLPRPAGKDTPTLVLDYDLGRVGPTPVTRVAMAAYDEREAMEFLHRRLQGYWRNQTPDAAALLSTAEKQEPELLARARAFDHQLTADLLRAGGRDYADLAILAYRQTLGAHIITTDVDGRPLVFSKENSSNGCTDTVDVLYPASPFFLLFNPRLLEAALRPVMIYASLPRWKWPFAPHDLGTFPLANGQVYGGGETSEADQMPVEESGNMLIMAAAIARAEGNPHFAAQWWPLLTKWAEYLRAKGLDPANQLSTDDFTGHLAHNANLSLKAVIALGAYAQLAGALHKGDVARTYHALAVQMAGQWQKLAADGDHTKLAFDRPGTWSQKYNLVWDEVLGLHLFPPSVAAREVSFYLAHTNPFGVPLDNRHTYTKLDWSLWSATLAANPADFARLVAPLAKFMRESPTRVPLSDWFDTVSGRQVGFQARSVVGGLYIKMLADPALWQKWAAHP